MNGKPFKYNKGTKCWDKQTDKSATTSTVANLAPDSRIYITYVTLWFKNMIKTLHRHRNSYYNCIGSFYFCMLLLHAAIHRPRVTDLKLWPFVLHHAVRLWSILPDQCTKLSPLELISGLHIPNYTHLQFLYFWGCPTFVFDPKLQDGMKLPKWSSRSHLGCFMGYSNSHSSTVSLILNMKISLVNPTISPGA